MRRPTNFTPLHHRGFRLLIAGQLASNVGDLFYAVALPWYVLATHGGALLLGTVLAAYGVPRTVLLAVGGHAADRFRPWNVMMGADAVRALAVAGLAVAAFAGPARAYVMIPIAIVLGAGEGMFLPSSMAIVPSLLPGEDLQAGNALASGSNQLSTILGPVLGGLVVAAVGPASAFVVDAASFVVSVAALVGVRSITRQPVPARVPTTANSLDDDAETASVPAAPTSVWGLLRSERILQLMVLVTIAANLGFGGMSEVALPALVHGPLHDGASGYGLVIAAFGGGALFGTLVAGWFTAMARPAVTASWCFLASAVAIGAVPYVGGTVVVALALALFGVANGFGNVVTITLFQRWAPPAMMGRLMGVMMLASMGLFPASVFVGGVVVSHVGPSVFFPLAGGALALAVLAALSQRSWREFGATVAP